MKKKIQKKCRLELCKEKERALAVALESRQKALDRMNEMEENFKAKLDDRDQRMRQLAIYESLARSAGQLTEGLARIMMYGTDQRFAKVGQKPTW